MRKTEGDVIRTRAHRRKAPGARAALLVGATALAAALAPSPAQRTASAQDVETRSIDPSAGDALGRLFEQARAGEADAHLPFVIARLRRALGDQDLLSVLELIEPGYFSAQYGTLSAGPNVEPAAALSRFACELFSICDVSKTYRFNDIVSAELLSVSPQGGLTGGLVEVRLELRMWDGLSLISVLSYDPSTARLSGPVG
ncbi:MAG: hypothetical protein AAGM38_09705 [Pseudomonadota bacterium]